MSEFDTIDFTVPAKKNVILVPQEFDVIANEYSGDLYGYIRNDTGVYVILGWDGNKPDRALRTERIGRVNKNPNDLDFWEEATESCKRSGTHIATDWTHWVHGVKTANGVEYRGLDNKGKITLKKEVYSVTQDVFSRNSGLLETDSMKEKVALIVGCGSVGSVLALQLARSGVGRFVLVDTDTIEIHNICRHQCNLTDVGRYKTDALRDRIIAINPFAIVIRFNKIIQNVTDEELNSILDSQSIIIGCGDNRLSDAFACELAYVRDIPFVSIGFWRRASVCEIVVCIHQRGDTCYRCAMKERIEDEIESRNRNRFYIGEEYKAKTAFEPGIAVDIEFGTSIGTKVVLDALNLRNPRYISKVLHTLSQYTLICNTNNPEIGGNGVLGFSDPLQVVRVKNIQLEKVTCSFCK